MPKVIITSGSGANLEIIVGDTINSNWINYYYFIGSFASVYHTGTAVGYRRDNRFLRFFWYKWNRK